MHAQASGSQPKQLNQQHLGLNWIGKDTGKVKGEPTVQSLHLRKQTTQATADRKTVWATLIKTMPCELRIPVAGQGSHPRYGLQPTAAQTQLLVAKHLSHRSSLEEHSEHKVPSRSMLQNSL